MRRTMILLLVAVCVVSGPGMRRHALAATGGRGTGQRTSSLAADLTTSGARVLTIHSALKLCDKHPRRHDTMTIRGFFAKGLHFRRSDIVMEALFGHPVHGMDVTNDENWVSLHGLRIVIHPRHGLRGKYGD